MRNRLDIFLPLPLLPFFPFLYTGLCWPRRPGVPSHGGPPPDQAAGGVYNLTFTQSESEAFNLTFDQ